MIEADRGLIYRGLLIVLLGLALYLRPDSWEEILTFAAGIVSSGLASANTSIRR